MVFSELLGNKLKLIKLPFLTFIRGFGAVTKGTHHHHSTKVQLNKLPLFDTKLPSVSVNIGIFC